MLRALALVVMAWLAGGACKQQADAPAQSDVPAMPVMPVMPAAEAKRGQDACRAYVEKVCACAKTVPAMVEACGLARALPEAIEVSLSVAASEDSTRRDVVQANDSVRKVVKECIEETAKLPGAGCAP
ncbi:MAG: hypothetical protein H7138_09250 [Myxococcales bacterium]|nr:hypothetical protein [Myxococcales bacterium]